MSKEIPTEEYMVDGWTVDLLDAILINVGAAIIKLACGLCGFSMVWLLCKWFMQ